jgi:RHS repeat-associated protein
MQYEQEAPLRMDMERDSRGKITRKTEQVRGREPRNLAYTYDDGGRLTGVDTALGQIETYLYENGLRVEAQSVEPQFEYVRFVYTTDHKGDVRLANLGGSKGRAVVEHDDAGHRILVERRDASEHYRYADGGLLAMRREANGQRSLVLEYAHDGQGGRAAKYVNGQLAEMYEWADALRLARCRTTRADMEFGYRENARIPFAMTLNGRTFYLFYDQVGSPRVVADERGNVVQEIRYDSFGRIVESVGALTDAGITLPIGFAGGLYDPDLGQCGYVRFGLRDYDPFTGRFTAKDPLGYAAGDPDLYGYCLDEPVNAVDPTGLESVSWGGAGRSLRDGPKSGNWCGQNWSGGWNPKQHNGHLGPGEPVSSMDAECKAHDLCYDRSTSQQDKEECDKQLVEGLGRLPEDPREWENPPAPGTENSANWMKEKAIWWFE